MSHEDEHSSKRIIEFYTDESVGGDASLGGLLRSVVKSMTQEVERRLISSDLTGAQWIPLVLIHLGRCSTATEIAHAAKVSPGALNRLITRIEEKGLLKRERCLKDRRVVYLHLTDAGRAVAANVPAVLAEVMNLFLAGFSEQEWQTLLELLKRIQSNSNELDDQPLE